MATRSPSRDHARLHRVQAAQLPDEQVEAEHARPRRVQEVLPLVRPHTAHRETLVARPRQRRRQRRRAQDGARRRRAAAGVSAARARARRRPSGRPRSRRRRRPAERERRRLRRFVRESWAELKKVEWPNQPGHPGHGRRHHRLRDRRRLPLARRPALQALRPQRPPRPVAEEAMFRWYVINTYSGHENKVKANLEHRIVSMNQAPRFRRVVVPTEQVIETKDGPEGADREARPARLRAREHGPERRGLDGRQEHAGRDRLRRRRLEARAALAARGRPDPPHRRRDGERRARRSSSRSASR